MINRLKLIYRFLLKYPILKLILWLNKTGNKKCCYVCQNTFNHFSKYKRGAKDIPDFYKKLDMVGSDVENFGCLICGAHDRERHVFMFFDKLKFWDEIKTFKILHFAPEKNLAIKINSLNPIEYIKADIVPNSIDIKKIDATNIPYSNNYFDIIIGNHILEHIPDYLKAMSEIYRVLKPGGKAILQTPFSVLLKKNFEDENINTDELRLFFYSENDHFRIFSKTHFFQDLEDAGFVLKIFKNSAFFTDSFSDYYGINKKEDLIQVVKA